MLVHPFSSDWYVGGSVLMQCNASLLSWKSRVSIFNSLPSKLATRRKRGHAAAGRQMTALSARINLADIWITSEIQSWRPSGGGAEFLGWIIGLGITALLMLAGVLPIYFILKKISGSKTTFAEDLQESFKARPQHRPETLGMLSALDSVESIFLQIYKYLLLIALVLGSVFIVWFSIGVQNDSE